MRLSDGQMEELAELWLGKIAVIEIRELRDKIGLLHRAVDFTSGDQSSALAAENARLREYIERLERVLGDEANKRHEVVSESCFGSK